MIRSCLVLNRIAMRFHNRRGFFFDICLPFCAYYVSIIFDGTGDAENQTEEEEECVPFLIY